MSAHIAPYPLAWPESIDRTRSKATSRFKTSLTAAMKNVRDELQRFAADTEKRIEKVVISSNVTLGVTKPADTGVAVWFVWDGMQVAIAVDRYPLVEHNLQAIFLILEARRTEMRHGGLEIVRATFRGFQALPPPPDARPWRAVLDLPTDARPTQSGVEAAFRRLSKERHPDVGGSAEAMAELNRARDQALRELAG